MLSPSHPPVSFFHNWSLPHRIHTFAMFPLGLTYLSQHVPDRLCLFVISRTITFHPPILSSILGYLAFLRTVLVLLIHGSSCGCLPIHPMALPGSFLHSTDHHTTVSPSSKRRSVSTATLGCHPSRKHHPHHWITRCMDRSDSTICYSRAAASLNLVSTENSERDSDWITRHIYPAFITTKL